MFNTASFPPSLPQEEKTHVQTNRRLTRRLKSKCQNIAAAMEKRNGGCRSCYCCWTHIAQVTRLPNAAFASNQPDSRGSFIIQITCITQTKMSAPLSKTSMQNMFDTNVNNLTNILSWTSTNNKWFLLDNFLHP